MSAAVERLHDVDSAAYQVQTFLDSVMPLRGNPVPKEYCEGYALISRYVMHLAVENDQACPPLTPGEVATVLGFLSLVEPRPGKEHHAAGARPRAG